MSWLRRLSRFAPVLLVEREEQRRALDRMGITRARRSAAGGITAAAHAARECN